MFSFSEKQLQEPDEPLVRQFHEWEKRGRGCRLWPHTVAIEPPFHPFLPDGEPAGWHAHVRPDAEEPIRVLNRYGMDLIELELIVPGEGTPDASAEQFLLAAQRFTAPVGFEIVVLPESYRVQFVCSESDFLKVHGRLQVCWPESGIRTGRNFLRECWDSREGHTAILDFGLVREFMVPLETLETLETDPLGAFTGALAGLAEGELALIQVLFQPAHFAWTRAMLQAAEWLDRQSQSLETLELAASAKRKASQSLFAAVVRAAAVSPVPYRAWEIVQAAAVVLKHYSSPPDNTLFPLSDEDYGDEDHKTDVLCRQTRRTGMVLNASELCSLVHFPLRRESANPEHESAGPRILPPWEAGHLPGPH